MVRQLCEGGELFDTLRFCPPLRPQQALWWFAQVVSAVSHCHDHGAAHGQFSARDCLLRLGRVQVVGFETMKTLWHRVHRSQPTQQEPPSTPAQVGSTADDPTLVEPTPAFAEVDPAFADALEATARASQPEQATMATGASMVELRPYDPLDAPELRGRRHAAPHELFACDVWALGVLLSGLLKGEPRVQLPGQAGGAQGGAQGDGQGAEPSAGASPGLVRGMRRNPSVATELSHGLDGMMKIGERGLETGGRGASSTSPTSSTHSEAAPTSPVSPMVTPGGMRRTRSIISSIEVIGDDTPSEVERLIAQMLQPKPQSRPSAAQINAQLTAQLGSTSSYTTPPLLARAGHGSLVDMEASL